MAVHELTPHDVALHLCGYTVVDVREADELTGELGRIAQAKHVPLATVEAAAAAWPRGDRLLLVCRSGGRSGRAAAALEAMGFADVTNLTGGMLAWSASGLPVVR